VRVFQHVLLPAYRCSADGQPCAVTRCSSRVSKRRKDVAVKHSCTRPWFCATSVTGSPAITTMAEGEMSINGPIRRARSVDTAATKETMAVRKGVLAPQ
jgi:hypothetical protein